MVTSTRRDAGVPEFATAVVDLLNSRAYANLGDKLDTPELAVNVLRPFGHADEGISSQRLDLVRAVRADLLRLADAHDPADPAADWAAFSGRVSAITFRQDFSRPGRVQLRQCTGDPVVGRIAQAVGDLVASGNWSRVRFCANDECSEAFYDATRSRTRRWHSYEICGNRNNVAAYRARTGS